MTSLRSIAISAVLAVPMLAVPALAGATSGAEEGGDVGSGGPSDGTAGPSDDTTGPGEGDVGSGGSEATGGPATGPGTSGGDTDTDTSTEPDASEKGCSIGAGGTAPGVLVLALLGLHGVRRRRA